MQVDQARMIRFPSIKHPRLVLPHIKRHHYHTQKHFPESAKLPVLAFRGTIKIHGCNAAIVQTRSTDGHNIHFQSRERVLAPGPTDLKDFAAHMSSKPDATGALFKYISANLPLCRPGKRNEDIKAIAVFGEWCGDNIQKCVAVSELPKMFVIFAVQVVTTDEEDEEWLDLSKLPDLHAEEARIFNVMQFPNYNIVVDFNDRESIARAEEKWTELTLQIEERCPVGAHFGVNGTGEGLVWQAIQSETLPAERAGAYGSSIFWFKTKGAKHAGREFLTPVAHFAPNNQPTDKMDALIQMVLTTERLEQGLQYLKREMMLQLDMKNLGAFIKWVSADVIKEEDDRIVESEVNRKAFMAKLAFTSKTWYIERTGPRGV